ncbi:MAG: hypothetical protein ACI31R_01700 [Bacilli bacterium]
MKSINDRYNEVSQTQIFEDIIRKYEQDNKIVLEDKYYLLIADYLECLKELDLNVDIEKILDKLPKVFNQIQELSNYEMGGNYGVTNVPTIKMNRELSPEKFKLYFFHELTHAIQTSRKGTGLYDNDKKNGYFFNEGLTQITAEFLYQISSETMKQPHFYNNVVAGQPNRTVYSSVDYYKINVSYLQMFAMSMGISLVDIMAFGYNENARKLLEKKFNFANNNEKNIDDILENLEEIHIVSKTLLSKQDNGTNPAELLSGDRLVQIYNEDGTKLYKTNFKRQGMLMDDYEQQMINMFFKNNNEEYVRKHEQEFFNILTTSQLKEVFKQYRQNWYNDMKNQRELLSNFIADSDSNEFLIENKEKIKNQVSNNALKREFDAMLLELEYSADIIEKENNKYR